MAIFDYKAIDQEGNSREGTIEAVNVDLAIARDLQRRGLVHSRNRCRQGKKGGGGLSMNIDILQRVTNEDVVLLSRQITSLFEAQISALRAFRLLAAEARTPKLGNVLTEVGNDIQSGSPISVALSETSEGLLRFLRQHGEGRRGVRKVG